MILELINIVDINISLLNLVNYLTVRAGLALFTSFALILFFGPSLINYISSFQEDGQPIREDGPQSHLIAKKGTPTMGGIIILLSIAISVLMWSDFNTDVMLPIIFIMLSFGFIGFIDDYSKVAKNSSNGISGRVRLLLQTLSVGIFIYWTSMLLNIENLNLLTLPLLKDVFVNLGYFSIPFIIIVIVGSANAVNLTDGLDGLAIVPVMIVAATFAIICYLAGNIIFSDYLHINYVPGAGELAILCGAMIGASLGFLWYNAPPAMVFMGDTGSLALGGTLGAISVIIKQELVLAIVGGIFVAEALSVILQVGSFKLTGKRIFRMAPLHHHFEHKGWPESQIVIRFWIVALILALIGLATLKIR
tara:strand:+ start:5694 stop:6782 length:1089 start_codon:yes stop_codon:yes gene_type:complete